MKAASEDFKERLKFCALCNMTTNLHSHLGGKNSQTYIFSTGKKRTISKLKKSTAKKTTWGYIFYNKRIGSFFGFKTISEM